MAILDLNLNKQNDFRKGRLYFAFVDLILVSMLISVVEEAFSRAQEEMRSNREGDKLFDSFRQQFVQFKKKYFQAKSVAKKGKRSSALLVGMG